LVGTHDYCGQRKCSKSFSDYRLVKSAAAIHLANKVDFVSYHFTMQLKIWKKKLKSGRNHKKPIVIQEFGVPSYKGIWNLRGSNEEDQAQYHKKMQPYSKKIILPLCRGRYMIFLMFQIKLQVNGLGKERQKRFDLLILMENRSPLFYLLIINPSQ
jgi:hypothetical protein